MADRRAVIWDLDGTLIDSMAQHWEAWRATLLGEGQVITYEQFVADFGKRNDVILRGHLGEHLADADVARIALLKEEHYRGLLRGGGLELLPGARRCLDEFRARGWAQALATSAPRGNIEAVFASLPIEPYFAAVVSAEDVTRGKPEPDVFLAAARKLGVAAARCVVIEDAPAGIEAGRRAGMLTVGVLTTHDALDADLVVSTLEQLDPAALA